MAPEYGATMGYFPVDDETLTYLRRTGRDEKLVALVERYAKEQGLFRTDATPDPVFTETLELDLGTVEPSLAGPKRPQDRVPLGNVKQSFRKALTAPTKERGFGLERSRTGPDGAHQGRRRRDRAAARGRGHRRHHLVHQHLQPVRAHRAPACWRRKRWRKGCACPSTSRPAWRPARAW